MKNIFIYKTNHFEHPFEIVERKGKGHPDTLSDGLAEYLSNQYSKYTKKHFSAILHHNFDKVGLLGGASFVKFGQGHMTKPIRVLINGRVSTSFGKTWIPVKTLIVLWTKEFLKKKLPLLDVEEFLEFQLNLSNQSSPGKTYEAESKRGSRLYWFEPQNINDLPERKRLSSNDTSLGVGYAPFSKLEKLVLGIEGFLNSENYHKKNKWIGSDIKVMGVRNQDLVSITICIPQLSGFVGSLKDYRLNLVKARKEIEAIIKKHNIVRYTLDINTRDNYKTRELYLTAIGSSLESGDEGLAGRGNRINGVITPLRPMSMEGSAGKNPVYHIGKIYYLAAFELARAINKKYSIYNEVFLVSQSGRNLKDPWVIIVNVPQNFTKTEGIKQMVETALKNIHELTRKMISGQVQLF